MICLHSMTDQTSCCVDDGLESVQELCRKADQQQMVVDINGHDDNSRHSAQERQLGFHWPVKSGIYLAVSEKFCLSSELCDCCVVTIYRTKWWWKGISVWEEEPTKNYIMVVVASGIRHRIVSVTVRESRGIVPSVFGQFHSWGWVGIQYRCI